MSEDLIKELLGDYGVFLNSMGKEQVKSYITMGISFKMLNIEQLVSEKQKRLDL